MTRREEEEQTQTPAGLSASDNDSEGDVEEGSRRAKKVQDEKDAAGPRMRRYGHVHMPEDYELKKAKGVRLFGLFFPTGLEFKSPDGERYKWSSRAHRHALLLLLGDARSRHPAVQTTAQEAGASRA